MTQLHKVSGVATNIRGDENGTHVRYHATDVVSFTRSSVVLRSGGWTTNTTKTRMNQAANQFNLGYRVYQKDYAWFVRLPNGQTVDFHDGMEIERP